jgi:hypothetical protein
MSQGASALWSDLVEEYCKCNLTMATDRLIAFFGVARLFQSHVRDQYLAGIWKSQLPKQLGWIAEIPNETRHRRYFAPSWSWAYVNCPIRELVEPNFPTRGQYKYRHQLKRERRYHSSIIEADARNKSSGVEHGQITGDHLTLNGIVVMAKCVERPNQRHIEICIVDHLEAAIFYTDFQSTKFEVGDRKPCFLLSTAVSWIDVIDTTQIRATAKMLVLEPVNGQHHVFNRIGLVELHRPAHKQPAVETLDSIDAFMDSEHGLGYLAQQPKCIITLV